MGRSKVGYSQKRKIAPQGHVTHFLNFGARRIPRTGETLQISIVTVIIVDCPHVTLDQTFMGTSVRLLIAKLICERDVL